MCETHLIIIIFMAVTGATLWSHVLSSFFMPFIMITGNYI